MAESVIINSVDRALDIIIYLYRQNRECSVTEISTALKVYKSTVFRTLYTLENKGFVHQNKETEKYKLGYKLYLISLSVDSPRLLSDIIKPYARKLNDAFDECINVSILDKNHNGVYKTVLIHKEKSHRLLNTNITLEQQDDCYCSAIGKCLLAYSNADLAIYEKYPMVKYTKTTITKISVLEKELKEIREKGYALDNEEREPGAFCIAVPLFMNGNIVASLSISGPTNRMNRSPAQFLTMLDTLKKQGEMISQELSASGGNDNVDQ